MGEIMLFVQVLKTQGPVAAVLVLAVVVGGWLIKTRLQTAKEERASKEGERNELFRTLNTMTAQTLVILREELKVAQESNDRFFAMMARNTSAMEKLVEQVALQGRMIETNVNDLRKIADDVKEIKGASKVPAK